MVNTQAHFVAAQSAGAVSSAALLPNVRGPCARRWGGCVPVKLYVQKQGVRDGAEGSLLISTLELPPHTPACICQNCGADRESRSDQMVQADLGPSGSPGRPFLPQQAPASWPPPPHAKPAPPTLAPRTAGPMHKLLLTFMYTSWWGCKFSLHFGKYLGCSWGDESVSQ